jgi:hypothetical protein
MRYIAIDDGLALLTASGSVKYQFKNGVLTIGTATGTGAGNEIVPDLANTDPDVAMQTLFPAGANDFAKVGQGDIFYQAPPITSAGTLASGSYYTIIGGTADLTNAAYVGKYTLVLPSQVPTGQLATAYKGLVIKATAAITVPADGSTWAISLSPRYLDDQEHNLRSEFFITNNLSTFKDESSWDEAAYGSTTKATGYVR